MVLIIISILLIAVAASSNAKMDKVNFHFSRSIYKQKNELWFNPAKSWKLKRDKQLWNENKIIPNWIPFFDFTSDFWHLHKTITGLCLFAVIFIASFLNVFEIIILIIIGAISWIITFNTYFNKRLSK